MNFQTWRTSGNCFLVEGYIKYTIHDFKKNVMHWVSPANAEIFKTCDEKPTTRNKIYEHVREKYPSYSLDQFNEDFKYLKENGLIKRGVLRFGTLKSRRKKIDISKSRISTFWCEITARCNQKCIHCYASACDREHHGMPAAGSDGNASMNPGDNSRDLPPSFWLDVIDQVAAINPKCLQFIGGEPLVYENFWDLVQHAVSCKKFEMIEIFTNCTLFKPEDFEYLKEHGIHVATTIYSNRPEIHDKITGVAGSFKRTWRSVENLIKREIPLRVACVVTSINEPYIDELKEFMKNHGIDDFGFDEMRPIGRADESRKYLPSRTRHLDDIPNPPSWWDFWFRHEMNSCWGHTACMRHDGILIPCIFARDIELGDAKKEKISEILNNKTALKIRKITMDDVEKCKDCEFRYCCLDCRPLAMSFSDTGNLHAPYPRCNYNPYEGCFMKANEKT
ncbi:MAG: radical SAM protein [Promethearchaeota archaeon]